MQRSFVLRYCFRVHSLNFVFLDDQYHNSSGLTNSMSILKKNNNYDDIDDITVHITVFVCNACAK